MKRRRQGCRLLFLITSFVVGSTIGICSQERVAKLDSKVKRENIVALRVTAPNGSWARITVREGGELRVRDSQSGMSLAFLPVVDSAARDIVAVKVFQIVQDSVGEKLYELESLGVPIGSTRNIVSSTAFAFEAEATVSRRAANRSPEDSTIQSRPGGGNCCVTCNGLTWCSNCSVQTGCGCCNTDACAGEC